MQKATFLAIYRNYLNFALKLNLNVTFLQLFSLLQWISHEFCSRQKCRLSVVHVQGQERLIFINRIYLHKITANLLVRDRNEICRR